MPGVTTLGAWRRDDELEASWPGSTPTNPGAGHRIPILSENITKDPEFQDRGTLFGQVSQEASKLAGFAAGGSIECDLRYGDLDRLYAACLGFENPNTDAAGGSPALLAAGEYRHVYECHEDLRSLVWNSGDRATSTGTAGQPGHWLSTHRKQSRGGLYIAKGVSDWRLWPAMVNGMEFNITPRQARVSFDLVGYNLIRGSYGSGSWTSYNGLSYNDDAGVSQAMLHQLTGKWGTAGASSWTNTDMGINSVTVRVDNGLKADDYDAAGGLYILEPWRAGMRSVSGSFTYTRYADDLSFNFMAAGLNIMLQFNLAGPSLGTNNAGLSIGLPSCEITGVSSPVGGPEIVQETVQFTAHEPGTLGTVWQGAGEPFEGVTLIQTNNGKAGEILLATVNEYDQNVFEND